MSSLDFPLNPIDGQEYSLNGVTYYYNAALGAWLTKLSSAPLPTAFNRQVLFNDAGLSNGSYGLVFDKSANTLFANTINVSSNMRVFGNLQVGTGTVTITNDSISAAAIIVDGSAIPSGAASNLAFAKANTALQNTSGVTFGGDLSLSGNLDLGLSTSYLKVPVGTTAQRPANPGAGYIRYNSTIGYFETYTGSGWGAIATPPLITSVSPSTYNGETGSQFSINGAYFDTLASVKFITVQGTEYTASVVAFANTNYLTANTPQDFTIANEPLSVKVTNASGLSYTLSQCIDCGGTPTWSTSSGTIATYYYPADTSYTAAVLATDPDSGGTIASYALASGTLPSGASLNTSNGAITGTMANPGSSSVTNSFDITATDNAGNQSATRTFNIVRKWQDGTSSAQAGTSASAIKSLTGTTSDGTYWLKPTGGSGSAFQTYCIMNRDGGGWAKVLQFHNATSMATTAAVNSGGSWINSEINLNAGKIATADWTALNTTNSFLMRVSQTSGVTSHRYWRYRVGGSITGHHPRAARLMLYDAQTNYYNVTVYVGDNCSDSGTIPGDGSTFSYDFGGPAQIRGVAIYSSFGGGTRNAYVYLDWSDDGTNWTNAGSGQMNASSCGIINWSSVSGTWADNLFYQGAGTAKLAYSGSLPAFGTDLDPTSNYTLYLDRASDGTYEYSATYTNDTRGRCNHTTNYWISDHNYNGTFSGTPPVTGGVQAQCWTIGSDRVVTNLHWMSGQITPSSGSINWGDTSTSAFSIFVK